MANTLKFGNGEWATKEGSTLAYNSENGNFKPLPFTFDRSTSATRVNKQGLIEVVSNNEPRIDFLNDSKGALLLEPSRSNIMPYSEDFSEWGNTSGITKTSSQYNELTGNNDAYKIETDGSSGFLNIVEVTNTTSGVNTFSLFAKKGTNNEISFRTLGTVDSRLSFNLDTGEQISSLNAVSTNFKDYGNGWYRISLTFDGSNNTFIIYPNIQGVANSGNIYVYGAQLEQGSYATSYIPTQGSSVTRVAEQGIDGGAGVPIFSNTSAVWFIDLERIGVDTDSSGSAMALRNSSFSQQIRLHFDAPTTNIRFRDALNGFATISTITGMSAGVRKKIALRIDGSALSTFANGSKIGSDYTAPSSFDIDEIDFSTLGFKIHDMRFNNEALTDQELINLTTI